MANDTQRMAVNLWQVSSRRWSEIVPLLAGIGTGAAGLVVSYGLKGGNLGRPLGDPVPLMLAVTQVPNGFTYFPWRPALYHLIFAFFLGLLAFVILAVVSRGKANRQEAVRAGRVKALLNFLVVAILQVDAVVVGFWYLVSGLVSIFFTGLAAGIAASTVERYCKSHPKK